MVEHACERRGRLAGVEERIAALEARVKLSKSASRPTIQKRAMEERTAQR
jgi:hypothetical protein